MGDKSNYLVVQKISTDTRAVSIRVDNKESRLINMDTLLRDFMYTNITVESRYSLLQLLDSAGVYGMFLCRNTANIIEMSRSIKEDSEGLNINKLMFNVVDLNTKLKISGSFKTPVYFQNKLVDCFVTACEVNETVTGDCSYMLLFKKNTFLDLCSQFIACLGKRTITVDQDLSIISASPDVLADLHRQGDDGDVVGERLSDIVPTFPNNTLVLGNRLVKFVERSLGDNTMLVLTEAVDDFGLQESFCIMEHYVTQAMQSGDSIMSIALLDITSLSSINMYNGKKFGDTCIAQLLSNTRLVLPAAKIIRLEKGTICVLSMKGSLELLASIETIRHSTTLGFSFRSGLASSNELGSIKLTIAEVLQRLFYSAMTRLAWDKELSRTAVSVDLLQTIMYNFTSETEEHCTRIQSVALILAEYFNLTARVKAELAMGSTLHDIGKIFIPPGILNKPGRLDDEERKIINTHTLRGASIFQRQNKGAEKTIEVNSTVGEIVLYHHERYDGSGYPYGLQGDEIPIPVAIVSLVDSVDAMLSKRVYKQALSIEYAVTELTKERGKQFHPDVVDAFMDALSTNKLQKVLNEEVFSFKNQYVRGDEVSYEELFEGISRGASG